jgi:hypothetical protein
MVNNPKYRWQLNTEQLEVLELLFRFRFASSELIAQYFGKKSGVFMHKRLKILQEQGFIGRRFDSNYRIQGKPAAYYLSPEGARKLQPHRESEKKDAINIKSLYKEKSVSESFIEHSLDMFAAYNQLKAFYGDSLRFFTKAELNHERFSYFPRPLPDAFLSLKGGGETKRFFLDLFDAAIPAFALNRRIKQYIDYCENGEWDATGSDFPVVLVICETPILQNRIEKRIVSALNNAGLDDLIFCTTNQQALAANESTPAVWRAADDPDRLITLREL